MIVQRWDTHEISLEAADKYANPFTDIDVSARLTHEESGKTFVVNGFYDGDSIWRLRFMPTEPGEWKYETSSRDPWLDGKNGRITCVKNTVPYLHGPLCCKGYHFFHADGTPRFPVSTRFSCHLAPPDVWRKAVAYLKAHRINRIIFMMGGRYGTTGCLFGKELDFWSYNVETFRAIDTFIDALRQEDIIASPYFYYFNDGMQRRMTPEQDKAFIRYGMARFGAYANVMPVLSNEVEKKFTIHREESPYDLRSHAWANEMGRYLAEQAVFGVPVTIHNPMEAFDAVNPGFYTLLQDWPFPWADCMLRQAQVGALGSVEEIRDDVSENTTPVYNARGYTRHNELLIGLRKFGIPVINEEPGYEMAGYRWENGAYVPRSWNSQNPDTILATFWTALTAGAYALWAHFDTYELGDPLPGIRRTISPQYLKMMYDFITGLPYWEMEPRNDAVSAAEVVIEEKPYRTNFCLAKEGETYLVFSLNGGPLQILLAPGAEYGVTQMNPRDGGKADLGIAAGGEQTISVSGKGQVLVFRRK